MEIYFCKTLWEYQSYTDFWKLVELSGFPIIKTNELDISKPGVYISAPLNGEWDDMIKPQIESGKRRNAHLIHWNIERPDGSAGSVHYYAHRQWELIDSRLADEVWVSDQQLANETGLRFVILGSDEGLGEPGEQKEYDFCHMSAPVPRRTGIYARFDQDKIGQNCWPPERDEVLKKSKFAFNIHQDNYSFQEPLRFALFAAYGLPIVSESLVNMYPYSEENIITATHPNLVGRMRQVLGEDYSRYREMGLKTREKMTKEFRFKVMIERAIKESVDRWR